MKYLVAGLGVALLMSSGHPFAQNSTIIQRVLVKVNGEAFTQKELEDKEIQILREQDKGDLKGDALSKAIEDMMPELLASAIDELIIVQRGRELGYHLSDADFKTEMERIKKDNNLDDTGFKTALTQEGLTLDTLRTQLDKAFIISTVQRQEIIGHMTLTEEEARQYYDKHPDEFMKPATVTLREILVSAPAPTETKPGQPQMFSPAVADAAREKITEIHDRLAKGEDFEKLVAEVSDAPTKSSGGLMPPIELAQMSTGIRDALDKMQPGDVTQPFRTPRGYQLFKLESRSAAERQPFEKVRDDITQKVGEARLEGETKKYLSQLRTQALIEWKRDDLRQIYDKRMAETAK